MTTSGAPITGAGGPAVSTDDLHDPVRRTAVERLLSAGLRSEGLDRITRLAATLLDAASAQVSLLSDVQHVVSTAGAAADPPPSSGPLEDSLCTVTAASGGPLAVVDAPADHRVRLLPPVTSGVVGAYLGVPLHDREGHVLGALCVFDPDPRAWTPEQVGILGELAPAVVAELELRAVTLEVATAAARLDLSLAAAQIGSFDWDMATGDLTWDERLIALFGYDRATYRPHIDSFTERVHPDDAAAVEAAIGRAVDTGAYEADYRIVLPDGGIRWVEARGRILRGGAAGDRMLGAAYDATARHLADLERERAYREREQAVLDRERAYAQAAAANTRLALLAEATATLGASLEPAEVLEQLAATVVPQLGRWVVVAVPGDVAPGIVAPGAAAAAGHREVRPVLVRHADATQQAGLEAVLGRMPLTLDDAHGVGAVLRTGVPEWLPEVDDAVLATFGLDEQTLVDARTLDVGRALTLPMVSRGRRLGALTVAEPLVGPLDRTLISDLAARAAVALDNALLYRAERRTGITLQRSLLPRDVPVLPGLEVAARYLPGDDGAFVGGDWYQGVIVDDALVLAMGDVMGHGMRSAARMGQLRAIVATLALEGHGPGALLRRLSESTDVLLDVDLATLLVARLEPASGRLVVASAGHPPPLVATPGQPPEFVDLAPGPPLGTFPGTFPEAVVDVVPGATVVLYTDGLVENRAEALSAGLERLRAALVDADAPAELLADSVLAATGRSRGGDDDVALLVLRRLVGAS